MWVSIHNTGLAVQGSSSRCLSRLPRVLPGLEEAVRASWVYSQKVLVIYGLFDSFLVIVWSTASSQSQRGAHPGPRSHTSLPTVCTDSPTAHTDTL